MKKVNKRKVVLIDMDRVLCNYEKSYRLWKRCYPMVEWPQSQPGMFLTLEPIEGGIESVKKLMDHYDVYILTRPSTMNPYNYSEKRVWIEYYFGVEFCKKLILCYDKSMVKGDYLIDDNLHPGFEGKHIHFETERFPDWKSVMDYLLPNA